MKFLFLKDYKKHFIFIILLLILFFLSRYFSKEEYQNHEANKIVLQQIQSGCAHIKESLQQHPIIVPILFSLTFFIITIFYIPFTGSFFVLFAGSAFGFLKGCIFYSFLVSISYTDTFLISKHFFYDRIHKKIGKTGRVLIKSFERDGTMYLLSLRFAGMIPAVVVNTAMGLTRVKIPQFYITTQLGTLPHVAIMIYAGTQIEYIKDINHLVPDSVFICYILLAILPILAKIIFEIIQELRSGLK